MRAGDEKASAGPRGASDTPAGKARLSRWLPLGLILTAVALFFLFDLQRFLSFDALAEQREWLQAQVARYGVLAVLAFIAVYALSVAVSLPGASLLTVFGGFLFGTLAGTAYVVVGASLGAAGVFLAARTALGSLLRRRVGGRLERMRAGFREDALSYLLVLRLIPIFPFWLVNLVPAFLGVPLRTFALATVIGIIPGSFVYASLGSGLGAVIEAGERPNLAVVFQPQVLLPLLGMAALALLPVAYKRWRGRGRRRPSA